MSVTLDPSNPNCAVVPPLTDVTRNGGASALMATVGLVTWTPFWFTARVDEPPPLPHPIPVQDPFIVMFLTVMEETVIVEVKFWKVMILFTGELPGFSTTGIISLALILVVLVMAEIFVSAQADTEEIMNNKQQTAFFISILRQKF
jgi:hypothetical protein